VALLRAGDFPRARKEVAVLQNLKAKSPMIDALTAQCLIANGELEKGLATYRDGLRANPSRRTLVYGYASALLDAKRAAEAVNFLTVKLETPSPDARLYELQSRGYSALGQRMLQHRAQAEAYVLRGNLPAAIEQLQLAQRAGDGDFYQKSGVEARLKELVAIDTEARRRP